MKEQEKKGCGSIFDCFKKKPSAGCSHESETYPSGHALCKDDQCTVCNNGEWVKPTKVRVPGILVE